jgi:hypothetical protein
MSDIEESVKEIEGVAENLDSENFSAADEINELQQREKKAQQQQARSKKRQTQLEAQIQTASEEPKPQQVVVESHAELLEKQERERLQEDIKVLLNKVAVHYSNIVIQERPGLVIRDHFGKRSEYYQNILEYMKDAPDIFLDGDLNKQKRLLTLLTDPAERAGAMDKIRMERLDPSAYTINK